MWGTEEAPPVSKFLAAAVLVFGAASEAHRAGVDERHDHATGVSHDATEHHFLLARDGGSIRLEVKDAGQVDARDRIREHLRTIAASFAAGDFSTPMLIHDQVPPGVEVMKERKAAIQYEYSPSDKGGVVRISTRDAAALEAVHEFLRFQIRDHGTGDSTE
jgi:hypothetical protein